MARDSRRTLVILVADDDAGSRELLAEWLRAGGAAVYEAADGEDALAAARAWKPDVVVLDLVMPRMNGRTLLREMKRDPDLSLAVTIVVSASIDEGVPDADAVLSKPVDVDRLRDLLGRVSRAPSLRAGSSPPTAAEARTATELSVESALLAAIPL